MYIQNEKEQEKEDVNSLEKGDRKMSLWSFVCWGLSVKYCVEVLGSPVSFRKKVTLIKILETL